MTSNAKIALNPCLGSSLKRDLCTRPAPGLLGDRDHPFKAIQADRNATWITKHLGANAFTANR
jgi:hypothetical protein